jgi:hypothetical protein
MLLTDNCVPVVVTSLTPTILFRLSQPYVQVAVVLTFCVMAPSAL